MTSLRFDKLKFNNTWKSLATGTKQHKRMLHVHQVPLETA
jgi:hypothetical protein